MFGYFWLVRDFWLLSYDCGVMVDEWGSSIYDWCAMVDGLWFVIYYCCTRGCDWLLAVMIDELWVASDEWWVFSYDLWVVSGGWSLVIYNLWLTVDGCWFVVIGYWWVVGRCVMNDGLWLRIGDGCVCIAEWWFVIGDWWCMIDGWWVRSVTRRLLVEE